MENSKTMGREDSKTASSLLSELVGYTVGLVLVSAGLLKLTSLSFVTATSDERLWPYSWFVVSVVELLLGCCLFSGCFHRITKLTSVLFFLATTCVGIAMAISGRVSCPCFGPFHTPTLASVAISLACLGMLFLYRPARGTNAGNWGFIGTFGAIILSVGALNAFSPSYAPMHLLKALGSDVYVVPERVTIVVDPLSQRMAGKDIAVINNTPTVKHVIGYGISGCSVFGIQGLPIEIPPYESRKLRLEYEIPSLERIEQVKSLICSRGPLVNSAKATIELYVDEIGARPIVIELTQVLSKESSESQFLAK